MAPPGSAADAAGAGRAVGAGMAHIAAVLALLIGYASLYPLTGWDVPREALYSFLYRLPSRIEHADLVQNVLAYMPLGLFLAAALRRTMGSSPALLLAAGAGALLSFAMESLQQFVPSRDPSVIDILLNIGGTCIGAAGAVVLRGDTRCGTAAVALRYSWLRGGRLAELGAVACCLWALSQTTPLVPGLDLGQLRSAVSPLYRTLLAPHTFHVGQAAVYALYLAGLGLLLRLSLLPQRRPLPAFALLVAAVFVLKIAVQGRQLSLEALAGAAAALLLLAASGRPGARPGHALAGMVAVAGALIIAESLPGKSWRTFSFNWVPLAGQLNSLSGFQDILDFIWPCFALACFARYLTSGARAWRPALCGGLVLGATLFWLEWSQQSVPGRYGDVTQVMLGCIGWSLPWLFQDRAGGARAAPP